MKNKFLEYSLNIINSNNKYLDETTLGEYRYGLESFYIFITKTIFIFSIAILLKIFKEMMILFLSFNLLRIPGAGMHASKSSTCLSSSTFIFIILPIILKEIIIPNPIKYLIGIIDIILVYIYAPADTEKKPIINAKRREKLKFFTTINCIILVILFLSVNNETISNLIISGIFVEIFLILPSSYKMFHQKYNNYLNYNK